jgi:hypothetical protein
MLPSDWEDYQTALKLMQPKREPVVSRRAKRDRRRMMQLYGVGGSKPSSPPAAWSPLTFGAALQWWFAAYKNVYSDLGSTPATNGQLIEQWNDQSTNADNATQTTGGNRPTFNTNQQNNLPAVQGLSGSGFMSQGSAVVLSGTFTLYAAVSRAASKIMNPAGNTTTNGILILMFSDNNLYSQNDASSFVSTAFTGSTGWILIRVRRDASNVIHFTSTGMGEASLGTLSGNFTINTIVGGVQGGNVTDTGQYIGEQFLTNTDAPTTDAIDDTKAMAYLKNTWTLTYP